MPEEWSRVTSADGRTFVFAESGNGPLVVFIHGFPDTPHGWERIAAEVAAAGYRTVRPWLRGYHPDTLVEGRPYDAISIGEDPIAFLDALGARDAVLVGHDWGASIVYDAANLHPERVRAIVPVAIPHPTLLPRNLAALWGARHFVVNKLPWAEWWARRRDFAYLDKLYRRWAPRWEGAERDASLANVKRCFADPRSLNGGLAYYRALRFKLPAEIARPPKVLGLAVGGSGDIIEPRLFQRTAELMADGSEALMIGGGHWPHRESEDDFVEALIPFLGRT
jgi:pimeloyl-ACP methyl ester carboxylesterase